MKVNVLTRLLRCRPKIDFALIGFPKTATTSIHHNLILSDKIIIPDHEVQLKNYIFNHSIYADLVVDYSQILGIKNPNLLYEMHNLHAMVNSNNNIKLIIGLRNPVKWLFSFYNYRILELKNNSTWIEKKYKTSYSPRDITFKDFNLLGACKVNGIYFNFLNNLLSFTDPINVHIYFMEDYAVNPRIVFQRVVDFIGIDFVCSELKEKNRKSKYYPDSNDYSTELEYLSDFYKPWNAKLNTLLHDKWGIENAWW